MLFPLANYIHFYNCEYFQSANTKICKRLVVSHVISTLYNQLISQKHWRVTMPYCGLGYFYLLTSELTKKHDLCQCPFAGQVISTRNISDGSDVQASSVSMPYCGPSHFYPQTVFQRSLFGNVSMPFCGPWHFYLYYSERMVVIIPLCQCPFAGQVISTAFYPLWEDTADSGVNALLRARSFLQGLALLMLLQVDVSMPYCGPGHFYAGSST